MYDREKGLKSNAKNVRNLMCAKVRQQTHLYFLPEKIYFNVQ